MLDCTYIVRLVKRDGARSERAWCRRERTWARGFLYIMLLTFFVITASFDYFLLVGFYSMANSAWLAGGRGKEGGERQGRSGRHSVTFSVSWPSNLH